MEFITSSVFWEMLRRWLYLTVDFRQAIPCTIQSPALRQNDSLFFYRKAECERPLCLLLTLSEV